MHMTLTKLPAELDRETMWRNFHSFRSSKDHFILWNNFLRESTKKGGPSFFQYVTSSMFKKLVKQIFPVFGMPTRRMQTVESLSYDEINILQYVSGFIPRNLIKKVNILLTQTKRAWGCVW